MKVVDIYTKYKITSSLQLHQLRVAAVAKQICDNLIINVNSQDVIKACLIHDMGNILKFDFTVDPIFFDPEGPDYWKKVQAEFARKYRSNDEHKVSLMIAKELNANSEVLDYIESIDFGKTEQTVKRHALEPKICDVADLRVAPRGVVSLDARLEEGNRRYKKRPDKWLTAEQRVRIVKACHQLEEQIFEHAKIKPSDITDKSIAPIVEQLKSYEI